jgi:hypothetical protein
MSTAHINTSPPCTICCDITCHTIHISFAQNFYFSRTGCRRTAQKNYKIYTCQSYCLENVHAILSAVHPSTICTVNKNPTGKYQKPEDPQAIGTACVPI